MTTDIVLSAYYQIVGPTIPPRRQSTVTRCMFRMKTVTNAFCRSLPFERCGIVDCHVHTGKWHFETEGDGALDRIRQLNKNFGISRSVVMISVPAESENLQANKQLLSEIGPDHGFLFFYSVDPRIDATSTIDAFKDRIRGLKLHPSHTRTRADDKKMEPFLEWCERNHKPLLVHCGRWAEYSNYQYAIETAQHYSFPFIVAHMGGPAYELKVGALEMLKKGKADNVFLDTSTCFQPHLIRQAVNAVGEGKVLFGSDYPLYHPALSIQAVLFADLPDRITASILGDNLGRLLNLRGEKG